MPELPNEEVLRYYEHLRKTYLSNKNDEDAKCKEFRTILEHFFKDYVVPGQPESKSLADLQALWYQGSGDSQMYSFLCDLRRDLNFIVHGQKHVSSKELLDYYFKCCVTVVYRLSGKYPDEQTQAAYGLFNDNYLQDLNEQQRDIILDPARIVYVNAGPGTGKTHMLVYKIVDLLAKRAKDAKIVSMSYTRSSAASLSAKLSSTTERLNLLYEGIPYCGTIHSFCLNSIKGYRRQRGERFDYIIADDSDLDDIIDDIYYSLDTVYSREVIDAAIRKTAEVEDERLRQVIAERKDIYKRISVGQILNLYLEEIKNNEDFVRWSSEKMNCLLVDEAQDLTVENYIIFDQLLSKIPDLQLFLVGDPRQNIFGFLGGSYKHLDNFLDKYKGEVSRKCLTYSYRCPQAILDFTNTMKFDDCDNIPLTSSRDKDGSIVLNDYDNEYEEAREIVKSIKEHGFFHSTAILCSRLRPLSKIVDELNAQGIAFKVNGGSNSIKPHIQAFNCMNRYVESNARALGAANNLCDKLERQKCRTLPEFRNTEVGKAMEALNRSYQSGNLSYVELCRKFVGFCRRYLPDGIQDEQDRDFKKLFDLVISKVDSPAGFSASFKGYRKQFETLEVDFQSTGSSPEAVTISTIHSAKGLEWDYVILPCMSDNYFPNHQSLDSVDPEERLDGLNNDRKLLFVAVTRSRKDLLVTYPVMISDSRTMTKASRLLGKLALL